MRHVCDYDVVCERVQPEAVVPNSPQTYAHVRTRTHATRVPARPPALAHAMLHVLRYTDGTHATRCPLHVRRDPDTARALS
jgi:hypothetical protein